MLQKNDPKDLNQIMFVQFLFAQRVMRQLPESILAPNHNPPTGKMLALVKEYNDGEYKDKPESFADRDYHFMLEHARSSVTQGGRSLIL